jgi:hypothetical protein
LLLLLLLLLPATTLAVQLLLLPLTTLAVQLLLLLPLLLLLHVPTCDGQVAGIQRLIHHLLAGNRNEATNYQ